MGVASKTESDPAMATQPWSQEAPPDGKDFPSMPLRSGPREDRIVCVCLGANGGREGGEGSVSIRTEPGRLERHKK